MKRKALCVLLSVFLFCFVLSGCEFSFKTPEPPVISFPQSYKTLVSFGELEAECEITCSSAASYKMTFSKPESLKQLVITLENSVYRYEILGIASEHKSGDMPEGNLASLIFSVLGNLYAKSFSVTEYKDGIWHYEGIAEGSFFILEQNNESGKLTKIQMPQRNLIVTFGEARG